jgi:4-amino-4-deoxy-L-arabinose transferase-like glycosyltransferase
MNLQPSPQSRTPTRPHAWIESPAWVLSALAAWLLLTIWARPLVLPDEGRYASVAWEMLSGDWRLPTLHGLPFFHKPPLTHWLGMAALTLFGPAPWLLRLAPALGAWLMGAALWLALRRWRDARSAGLALLVLATNPFYFIGAQFINHDMLVAGWIGVASLCWVRAFEVANQASLRWLVAGWVAAGLGFLSKGLIGAVLPLWTVGPWLLAQRRWRDTLRLAHPVAVLAGAAVALPWLLTMQQRYPGFLDYFIVEQHFRRYSGAGFNNPQPFWFYLAVLPLLTLPWSLWLPVLARRVQALRDAWPPAALPALNGLWLWWAAATILFFSLPQSKLVGYVLPALPAWAALLAFAAAPGRRWRLAAAAGALACVGAVALIGWQVQRSNRDVALTLGRLVQPADVVVFVDGSFYDVPIYAALNRPPLVASDWENPALTRGDGWRKELTDAARFDPAQARERLWPLARLRELACRGVPSWYLVEAGRSALLRSLPGAVLTQRGRISELWHAPAQSCSPAGERMP